MKRALAGMPFIISVAQGPGRVAFSRDATGELVLLPLHPGMEMDVREHAFLLAYSRTPTSSERAAILRFLEREAGALTTDPAALKGRIDPAEARRRALEQVCRVVLNSARSWNWDMLCTTVVHEYGHLAGHGHSDDQASPMHATYDRPYPGCVRGRAARRWSD